MSPTHIAGLLARGRLFPARLLAKGSVMLLALTQFTYVALFIILVIAGSGAPIPEDIPLALSGYLCNQDHSPIKNLTYWADENGDGIKEAVPRHIPRLPWMIAAGLLGVLTGDTVVFFIGRHGLESNNIITRHLRKVMHSKRREKVERHFAKHGNLTVLAGRFMPGFRSLVFAFAGLSKMSYPRFLLIDGLAAAVSVPSFIVLGWYFADRINALLAWMDRIKHWLIPVALVCLGLAALVYYLRRRRAPAEPAAPTENVRSDAAGVIK